MHIWAGGSHCFSKINVKCLLTIINLVQSSNSGINIYKINEGNVAHWNIAYSLNPSLDENIDSKVSWVTSLSILCNSSILWAGSLSLVFFSTVIARLLLRSPRSFHACVSCREVVSGSFLV